MTKRKPKPKIDIPTRKAGPKGPMFQNLRRPEQVESLSLEELVAPPTQSTEGTQSTLSTLSTHSTRNESDSLPPQSPVAPVRDFQKVANSITREALPAGLFKGASKKIYDFLYSKTRGAIAPARTVRLTRREIMEGADVGSTKTLYLNLQHLRAVGLITWQEIVGPHGGNEYTVHLPGEAMGTQSTLSTLSTSSYSSPKVLGVLRVESTQSTHSLNVDNSGTSEEPKTSFKTKEEKTDDELRPLREAERELTGKNSPPEAWRELAELLVAELRIAAGRTTISSVPAFLTEHLRRRLWKKEKRQIEAEPETAQHPEGPRIDTSQCPDCFGTGMFYPEGYERGVARCAHEKLVSGDGQA
jgi:hypothetical protein